MIGVLALAMMASALVYAVLAFVGDGAAVAAVLADFPLGTGLAMLLLGLGGHVIRSLRWGALMRLVGYPVTPRDALYLHMSGQTMSVTPGRIGEVFKPWLARETAGMPMSAGVALVFAERVADLLAVCVLSLGGLSLIRAELWGVVVAIGVIVGGAAIAGSAWFHRLSLGIVVKQRWAREHQASAAGISQTIRRSLAWRTLAWSVPASFFSWGLEGIGFYLCIQALGFDGLSLPAAVSIYAVATIVGAFTFLPGGIGATEASMAGILVAVGMLTSAAAAATLLTRVATLWWAVLLGWIVLATRPAIFKRLLAARQP